MSVNKVILLGHLGQDVKLEYTPNSTAVGKFSIATSKKINNEEKTQWTNIVVWKDLAENCERYLKKGSQVYLEGELETRNYENKEGVKVYVTEVIAYKVDFLDKKESEENNAGF